MVLKNKYADFILKLFLKASIDDISSLLRIHDLDWDLVIALTRENRVLIRTYENLIKIGVLPGRVYKKTVAKEKERISNAVELMGIISEVFNNTGIDFVFIKNYQHYPDMGDDIDLFVMDCSCNADSIIIEKLGGKPFNRSLLNRIGEKTQYYIKGYPSEVEIHHGHMGPMGEHTIFPKFLIKNRTSTIIDDIEIFVPCVEDQFIIQILQRVYGRFYLRISEIVYSISAILEGHLDWNYIAETTKSIGIFEGYQYYLCCLNMIYKNIMQKTLPLKNPELLDIKAAPKIRLKGFHYRLPLLTVGGSLYPKKIFSDIQASNWVGASRLGLLPIFATIIGFKSLVRRCSRN
jgi:hypothetical protein